MAFVVAAQTKTSMHRLRTRSCLEVTLRLVVAHLVFALFSHTTALVWAGEVGIHV